MLLESLTFSSLAGWLGGKLVDKGFEVAYDKLVGHPDEELKFRKCITNTASILETQYPDILGGSISYFFSSKEIFDELCKLLFLYEKINPYTISKHFDTATLPKEFISDFIIILREQLSKEPLFYDIIADKEIYLTVKGISKDINVLSANSELSYIEILEIKKMLEVRIRDNFNSIKFKANYLKILINNLNTLNHMGLGINPSIKKGKTKSLSSIYVKPVFKINSKHYTEFEDSNNIKYENDQILNNRTTIISYRDIFDRPYNYIVLGNPGSGKSVLIKSIIVDIAKNNNAFTNRNINDYIPFRIELKNYLAHKKATHCGILKYLIRLLDDEYSISDLIEDNLQDVLLNNKVIFFFDGLDEIFDINDKQKVKNDIENFHTLFPNIRSITTSRFIGYNDARLNDEMFCELNITPFNDEQISQYVVKWYSLEEDDQTIRTSYISDFLSKRISVDDELISNPLLLSLIIILHRNNLRIPESKLEIYQSCTNTLVDKWDASKNLDIHIDNIILQKKESIFSDLAFWQYKTLSSNGSVTYSIAKEQVADALKKKKLADDDNSSVLAEAFLDYAQKRSIYFDNNFTHKTFLEYYTAYWIYSNIEKKHNIEKRDDIFQKYISNPFWYIVLELLLNMIDDGQADNDILDNIFLSYSTTDNALPFLAYAAPNIKNISKEVIYHIYEKSIRCILYTEESVLSKELFIKIKNNISIEEHDKIIAEAINCLRHHEGDFKYHMLVNELIIHTYNKSIKEGVRDIIMSSKYIEYRDKYPSLYHLDMINFGDPNHYFENTIRFIDLFGISEIFEIRKDFIIGYLLGDFFTTYLRLQLNNKNVYQISSNIEYLSHRGLNKIQFIRRLLNNKFFYVSDLIPLQYLCDEINHISDEKCKVILVLLLISSLRTGRARRNISKLNVPKYLKELLKTRFSEISINTICDKMNITDPDIKAITIV